jgi:hypothetical protein
LSHERLTKLLSYDSATGVFRWNTTRSWRAPAGSVAGTKSKNGLPIAIGIEGVFYRAHQLAWFYVNGVWAECEIDHKDCNPQNNAIANLRRSTRNGNVQNVRKARVTNKSSGLLGAYKGTRGRWFSSICVESKSVYLGTFDSAELAHGAYLKAKRALHSTCTI